MVRYFKLLFDRMKTHDLFAHSAEAAYYLFVSFFPFMILLVSALSHVGLISVFLEREMTFLPGEVWAFVHDAVIELEDIDSLAAVPFSVITLLWSASRGMTAVTKPLRLIYGNSKKRKLSVCAYKRNCVYSWAWTVYRD